MISHTHAAADLLEAEPSKVARVRRDPIRKEAARWLVALKTGEEETKAEFIGWVRSSPEHFGAFLRVSAEEFEDVLDCEIAPDGKGLKDLTLINWGSVRLAAFQITRNVSASEDIAQSVFVRLMGFPQERLEGVGRLEAFAAQAARNEARNWRREHLRYVPPDSLTEMPAGEHCDPASVVGNQDEALHALAKLSERDRMPFILCKMFGYSAEEAAAQLGISVEAVWKRIQRAFETLVKAGLRPSSTHKLRIRCLFDRKEP